MKSVVIISGNKAIISVYTTYYSINKKQYTNQSFTYSTPHLPFTYPSLTPHFHKNYMIDYFLLITL